MLFRSHVGRKIAWQGKGVKEKGVDPKTGDALVQIDPRYFRPTEVDHLEGDSRKARKALGWKPKMSFKDLVDDMIESTWRGPAERRGYVVIEPAAPNDERFFQKGERVFPGMLTALLAEYKVLGNKFHIAGISAGGTSAFWIAAKYPQYFYSVTAFPGSLWEPTPERLNAFADLCIYMFVGENDEERTRTTMQQQAETFRAKGFHVAFAVERNEEHVMLSLTGRGANRLFAQFEQARKPSCGVKQK